MANSIVDDYSDLIELGIDISEGDALTIKFNKCIQHIQTIASSLDNKDLLRFYAYYKQSIEGPCCIPRPSWYDVKGKAKWEAWNNLGNMNSNEAKNNYVELTLKINPSFTFDEATNKSDGWIKVSSLARQTSYLLEESITDHIRSGDVSKVVEYLKLNNACSNLLDNNGMGLLHYAADIGNLEILDLLLSNGFDVNLQDNDGQTALHYAASCGHIDCITFLVSNGAGCNITDSDGCAPVDVASDEFIKKMLQ